jgi:hypothetical protein
MAKPFESIEERILGISKERLDAADAELEAERNDPDFEPPAVEWLDDPDPFGMDWDWLLPRPEASPIASKTLAEPAASPTAPQIFGVPRRRVVTALAWAASILLVFSVDRFVLRPGGEADLDATGARITPGGALGGQAWTLEVPSDRRAFITIAVLGSDNVPEYHPEAGKLLETQPGTPLTYTIQGDPGDSAFVILTETPAGDLLHDKTDFAVKTGQQTWRDADSFRTFLEETLRSLGFRHFAVRRIVLTR